MCGSGFTLNTLLHSDGTGDATVLQTHRYTPPDQLVVNARQADIIIVACGELRGEKEELGGVWSLGVVLWSW